MLRFIPRKVPTIAQKSFTARDNNLLRTFQKNKFSTVKKNLFVTSQIAEHHKPLRASKIVMLTTAAATISSTTTPLLFKKPIQCQAAIVHNRKNTAEEAVRDDIELTANIKKQPIIRKGELSFGAFLGLCTGYFVKKLGKIFIGFIGATFIFLQYLSFKGFITVHWDRIEGSYTNTLDSDKDGKVTARDLHTSWTAFIGLLTHNIQFKTTFVAGFYTGIRYG